MSGTVWLVGRASWLQNAVRNYLDSFSIVFFLAVALTSSVLIIERMEGLLDRSWVAGVTPGEILFSHVITQFVVMCGQTALVLIFMILVFGVECKGDIGWVIVLTILQGLCGMCFGKRSLKKKEGSMRTNLSLP